ncbi:MAG: cob(I)yrinic acid a,c-diamide adenosyltransferase [Acidimicrobiia bacterium]|nr:cob(I)yrinic acid a,c-diamide adenosyltransferase [Acidimicrobiia bacterium]
MKIYTRTGDDGTTGLLFGGRVPKDSPITSACGDVDEAQAALGLVRSVVERNSEVEAFLVALQREMWVLMAELSTAPDNRHKLAAGQTLVTAAMVEGLEALIDDLAARADPPTEFVVPGQTPSAAFLDLARTIVRRAERHSLAVAVEGSLVVPYLNRLSDLLWTMARWQEGESLTARAPRH